MKRRTFSYIVAHPEPVDKTVEHLNQLKRKSIFSKKSFKNNLINLRKYSNRKAAKYPRGTGREQ